MKKIQQLAAAPAPVPVTDADAATLKRIAGGILPHLRRLVAQMAGEFAMKATFIKTVMHSDAEGYRVGYIVTSSTGWFPLGFDARCRSLEDRILDVVEDFAPETTFTGCVYVAPTRVPGTCEFGAAFMRSNHV